MAFYSVDPGSGRSFFIKHCSTTVDSASANRLGKGSIYLFEKATSSEMERYSRCKRYPDYIKEDFILDAKYKKLDSGHINRDDMHQLISYMYVEQASKGGFIHPQQTTQVSTCCKETGALRGYGGTIYLIGVPIPTDAKSYQDFIEQMQQTQQRLKQAIRIWRVDCRGQVRAQLSNRRHCEIRQRQLEIYSTAQQSPIRIGQEHSTKVICSPNKTSSACQSLKYTATCFSSAQPIRSASNPVSPSET